MAEYIDREELLELYETGNTVIDKVVVVPLQVIRQNIMDMPDVDVAPVKRGHWVSLTDCSNAGVYCSNCHKKVYKEDYASCNRKNKLRSNYCPNCGAKMYGYRKEGDDNG